MIKVHEILSSGGLSHTLAKVCEELNKIQFVLIERGAVRYKASYLKDVLLK